ERQIVQGESDDAPLGFGEITDQAEGERVEIVALANGVGVQILGKRLARLLVMHKPVAVPSRRQGISHGAQLVFDCKVRLRHGCLSSSPLSKRFRSSSSARRVAPTSGLFFLCCRCQNGSEARSALSTGRI